MLLCAVPDAEIHGQMIACSPSPMGAGEDRISDLGPPYDAVLVPEVRVESL